MSTERKDPVKDYLDRHDEKLDRMQAMWEDEKVQFYNDKDIPAEASEGRARSIFLAGPTSREQILMDNYRCDEVHFLREYGFDGWIFVPEPRGTGERGDFTDKEAVYRWESSRLFIANETIFWLMRNDRLLGLNTAFEHALMAMRTTRSFSNQRLWVGHPPGTKAGIGLAMHYMDRLGVPKPAIINDLERLCRTVAEAKPKKM